MPSTRVQGRAIAGWQLSTRNLPNRSGHDRGLMGGGWRHHVAECSWVCATVERPSFGNPNLVAGQYAFVQTGASLNDPRSDAACLSDSLRDPQQFTVIFERHAASIHRYLNRAAEKSDVDDLLSEVFVAAFRSRHRYNADFPDARPWLFGIATNVLRHHRRSKARYRSLLNRVQEDDPRSHLPPEEHGALIEQLAVGDETALIRTALLRLEPKYRDVLMLSAGPQLSYEEIARVLGTPVGTVRSRLHRGRGKLRELLRESGKYQSTAETRGENAR